MKLRSEDDSLPHSGMKTDEMNGELSFSTQSAIVKLRILHTGIHIK